MAELLLYLVPKRYTGHLTLVVGIFTIIISTLFLFSCFFDYMNILGQICLIIGIFGIYFRKKKNLYGIEGNVLCQKNTYVFYVIIIVGIGFSTLFTINYLIFINTIEWGGGFFSSYGLFLTFLYVGDLFLIIGLRTFYAKKKKEN